ncbi:MAG: NUMOD4 domain-containing protein [Thermodesulforhabdaceae bacterium]
MSDGKIATSEGAAIASSFTINESEIWKDIPGYEGRYQASNLGRIKSLKRKVRSVNHYTGKEFFRVVPERILRLGKYW